MTAGARIRHFIPFWVLVHVSVAGNSHSEGAIEFTCPVECSPVWQCPMKSLVHVSSVEAIYENAFLHHPPLKKSESDGSDELITHA